MKELPKIFANPIDKDLHNNSTLSYGRLMEDRRYRNDQEVINKINRLFKNDDTIYSIDCIITFENYEEKYTIIGKTNNNLITKTQKLIPIREIYDIELA